MTERVLIDTGPMVALFSEDDEHHRRCSDALTALTPSPLHLLAGRSPKRPGCSASGLIPSRSSSDSFDGGLFALLTLDVDDLPAIAAMMKRYESSGLQFADATLAHLAERENIRTVFTTDRRDFSIIRLKRNRTLKLLPEVQ